MKPMVGDRASLLASFYLGEEEALRQLAQFDQLIDGKRNHFIGYPCNSAFVLTRFFDWWNQASVSLAPLNDVGSPDGDSLYNLNAHLFEKEVIEFFSRLFSIESSWGYITSGGTQGNEQGLYIGRQVLEKYGKPVIYFSEEAHYSIASLSRLLGLEATIIGCNEKGEMDYEELNKKLNRERPALFSVSIGTTFKGAIDQIAIIDQLVKEKGIEQVYYHADAALFGGYLPFLEEEGKPELNFAKWPYDSIAISGHKFFGSPIPMGVCLTRKEHISSLKKDYIEYIHSYNLTIPCSRSSLNSLMFWWILATTRLEEWARQATALVENAHYLYLEIEKLHYPVGLNSYSNTVYFKKPSDALCKHWCLSITHCRHWGELAHVVVMQHVDKPLLEEFIEELADDRARGSKAFKTG